MLLGKRFSESFDNNHFVLSNKVDVIRSKWIEYECFDKKNVWKRQAESNNVIKIIKIKFISEAIPAVCFSNQKRTLRACINERRTLSNFPPIRHQNALFTRQS